jgi:hypothetical protein
LPTASRPDVVVVPARSAYPKYLRYSGYFCQPGRAFRDDRLAGRYLHAEHDDVDDVASRADEIVS